MSETCLQNFFGLVPLYHVKEFHDSRGTRDARKAKLINCSCERHQLSYTSGLARVLGASVEGDCSTL